MSSSCCSASTTTRLTNVDLLECPSPSVKQAPCGPCACKNQQEPATCATIQKFVGSAAEHEPHPSEATADPEKYLLWYLHFHRRCLEDRNQRGPGRSLRMDKLYRYWCHFLRENFNEPMYTHFCRFAEEDASAGFTYGMQCLFEYYSKSLQLYFDADRYGDFKRLAFKYYDYMGVLFGLEQLYEFHTICGLPEGCGVEVDPQVDVLLEAWKAMVQLQEAREAAENSYPDYCGSTTSIGYKRRKNRTQHCRSGERQHSPLSYAIPTDWFGDGRSAVGEAGRFYGPETKEQAGSISGRSSRSSSSGRSTSAVGATEVPACDANRCSTKRPDKRRRHKRNSYRSCDEYCYYLAAQSAIAVGAAGPMFRDFGGAGASAVEPFVPEWRPQSLVVPGLGVLPDRLGEIFGD